MGQLTWLLWIFSRAVYTPHTTFIVFDQVVWTETAFYTHSNTGKIQHVVVTGPRAFSPTFFVDLAIRAV